MSSKIEQLLDEVEDYIESCKYQPLSNTKIIVNKEEIDELIRELRSKIPDEVKQCQKIVSNQEAILKDANVKRDSIINDAKAKAEELITQAGIKTNELVSENEIMKQAYERAQEVIEQAAVQARELLDNATIEANQMRMGAMRYTDDSLGYIETILSGSLDAAQTNYGKLIQDLKQYQDVVKNNRSELHSVNGEPTPESGGAGKPQAAKEGALNVL